MTARAMLWAAMLGMLAIRSVVLQAAVVLTMALLVFAVERTFVR
ncbi:MULTISPECIES: hypothetical protein [Pseudonocardia]|uniref:Uncharacterized protein n=2 Tax=Pseudonocardia TaxID=1847 RepID=A0A1Y2MMM6_PSEAH|nr:MULTISPECIES: hypothetical protein [Pseudonocardia]OSY35917.1 hypothetical protein BG845_05755 [Pseudonocardia autotrophica]TDN73975.1 hypothetical protein C8E95_3088 [Pseudonocardia autotrophica]BBG04729.1 hypothetical protein Pdca_59380 [Pseudonocardia autotrophica]GEC28922.1 hypothetical protein PSA01_59510 [Pseudonocardia saturnea]